MSREIKFRDYDMETKQMRFFDMDSYDRYEHDSYGNIMQFTGLKDEKRVEIYEGDIIQTPLGYIGQIIFGFKSYRTISDIYECHGWIFKSKVNGHTETLDSELLRGIVIGNIHQNPELLEK